MKSITVGLICLGLITFVQCWNKKMENPGFFQGDILLDPDEDERNNGKNSGNTFASVKGRRWPNAKIPYIIDSSLGYYARQGINAAIADYHKYTCIRFTQRNGESSYVKFFKGGGCYSPVGWRSGRENGVSIGSGCESKATVIHEIGHTIGLWHEQNRPDRDQFVKILEYNVPSNMMFNYHKKSYSLIDSLGTPYDYHSVMHYDQYAFGGNRITIQTLDRNYQNIIGRGSGFSKVDIEQINLMYPNCKDNGGSGCTDLESSCPNWEKKGFCKHTWVDYMAKNCKKSCNLCGSTCKNVESDHQCNYWKGKGFCQHTWVQYMKDHCAKTCKHC